MEKQPCVRHAAESDAGRSFQPIGRKSPRRAWIIQEQSLDCGRIHGLLFGCLKQSSHPGAATLHHDARGFAGRIVRAITLATRLGRRHNLGGQVGRHFEGRGPKQGHSQQKREKGAKQCIHARAMTQAVISRNTRPVDGAVRTGAFDRKASRSSGVAFIFLHHLHQWISPELTLAVFSRRGFIFRQLRRPCEEATFRFSTC